MNQNGKLPPAHLRSRRRFLGGAAVTVGLPFFASLGSPRSARGQTCPPAPKRFLGYYWSNGVLHPDWTPPVTGKSWHARPPFSIEPLLAVKNRLLVFSGLENGRQARPSVPPGNHAGGTGCFLTQIPVANNLADPRRTSIDQTIADHLKGCTRVHSMQVGLDGGSTGGNSDGALSQFTRCISWRANTPQPNATDPRAIFDRLFAGVEPSASAGDAQRRLAVRTSVLDHVLEDMNLLAGRLAPYDRKKLDQYATAVRELETQIQRTAAAGGHCGAGAPMPAGTDIVSRAEALFSLIALAFQCDATRVVTFMADSGGSGRNYSFIGVNAGYHGVSHHQRDAGKLDAYKKIVRWHMEQMAKLLVKLDAVMDPNGKTALENTVFFGSSEVSDGDRHNHWHLPVVVAGGAGHFRTGGEHVSVARLPIPIGSGGGPADPSKSLSDLFLSMLHAFDIPATKFAVSSGPLEEALVSA